MIGGAGGAYSALFSDFDTYYPLLFKLLRKHRFITGIDLDIEESVNIKDVKKLMNKLISDFGEDLTITMAPVSYALMNDGSGLGGFSFLELYNLLQKVCFYQMMEMKSINVHLNYQVHK